MFFHHDHNAKGQLRVSGLLSVTHLIFFGLVELEERALPHRVEGPDDHLPCPCLPRLQPVHSADG